MKQMNALRRCCVALLGSLAAVTASATTYNVDTIPALQTAIDGAVAGDVIIVQNGMYTTTGTISINRVGSADSPILITAESIGGVTIAGSGGFRFASPAAYVTIQGFNLFHAGSINMPTGTSHCRLTRNVIQLSIPAGSDVSYVNISGNDHEIDYNELRNKSSLGNMLDITGSGGQVARRLWVHHNYFHDFTSPGGNGAETVRWGLSGLSLSDGEGLCEYNLFVRCNGENEMISNKSSSNTFRYNTVLDSPGGEISQRHGNDCLYYGNYMRNTAGIRVYGDRHQIFSNYLEGNALGINMGNGDGDVYNGALLTAHDRPDDNVVTFNTLINNGTQYQMGGRTNGLGATNTTFANNIMQGGTNSVLVSTSAPYTNPVWGGNIVWNVTNGAGTAMPAGTYMIVDPLLAADANGILRLQAGSPAIDAATGTYAAVTFDQDGQPRPGIGNDIGADEVSSAIVTAKFLTPTEVGPSAGLFLPAATPTFSLPSGIYSGTQAITISTVTLGASIRYTTDGSTPSEVDGTLYTGPVTVESTTTLKAIAYVEDLPNSMVSTVNYTITSEPPVATPIFTPPGGTYPSIQSVTITTATAGASIRYTTDGSNPTPTVGTIYSGPITVNTTSTLKAIAYAPGLQNSTVATSAYSITIAFEAEVLAHTEVGGTYSISFEDSASGGQFASPNIADPTDPRYPERRRYVTFGADGTPTPPDGEYIEFTLPDIPAGTFNFVLRYKSHNNNRSVMQLSIDGVALGGNLDQRASATFRTRDFGVVRFATAGDRVVRLAVVGKTNATTTPWNLTADVIILVPDTLPPVISPLPNLTVEATGTDGAIVTYAGTATDAKDGAVPLIFTPASGSLFPIGMTSVTADAVDFAGNASSQTFMVTVTPSYGSWAGENGLTPANNGIAADADADGIANLLEYFLGLRPTISDRTGLPTGSAESGDFVFRFNRAENADGVTSRVLVSSDLVTWEPVSPEPELESSTETLNTYIATIPFTAPRMFARLEVTSSGGTVATVPIGYMKVDIAAAPATTVFGVPLDDTSVPTAGLRAGRIESFTANTLTNASGGWTDNLAAPASPWLVRLTSGAYAGKLLDITANTATTLTLGGANLTTLGLTAGLDTFELVPVDTLASLFGGSTLLGGTSASAADNVYVRSSTSWLVYFYDTNLGFWRRTFGPATNANNIRLRPETGVQILRRGPATTLTFTGRVLPTPFRAAINNASSTAIHTGFPTDTTLGALAVQTLLPGWRNGTSSAADQVFLFNGTTWIGHVFNGASWQSLNGAANSNALALPAGSLLLIQRPGTKLGTTDLINALPYSP